MDGSIRNEKLTTSTNFGFYLAAALLLTAAIFKTVDFVWVAAPTNLILGSTALTSCLVILEIIVATWLLSGFMRRESIAAAICLFACFFIYAMAQVINGSTSCGCFGLIDVPPHLMAIVDLFILASLLILPSPHWKVPGKFAVSMAILLVPSTSILIMSTQYRTLSGAEVLGNTGQIVVDTGDWIGKPCPLLQHLPEETSKLLSQGNWELLLIDKDCNVCESKLPALVKIFGDSGIVVEVSSFDRNSEQFRQQYGIPVVNLNEEFDWFAEVPLMIYLSNGSVTATSSRDDLLSRL